MERTIELYTCCGNRSVSVAVDPAAQLSGEAWRLARCLRTTDRRRRGGNGVIVESLQTNLEHARAEGWSAERIERTRQVHPAWADRRPRVDWRFRPFHIWPDHQNGPHPDPDQERLTLLALAYLQREAQRITAAGGTVIAAGDLSVRLLPQARGEQDVVLPDEQTEARVADTLRALLGGNSL